MQVKRKNCQLFGIKNFKISKLKHKGLIDKISINQHETSAICLSFITLEQILTLEQRPQDPIKFKIQVKQAQQMLQQEHVVTPSEYE